MQHGGSYGRRRPVQVFVFGLAVGAVAVLGGCQLLAKLEPPKGEPSQASEPDGSLDATLDDASSAIVDPCGVDLPRSQVGPQVAGSTVLFAVRALDFGPRAGGREGGAPRFDASAALCPDPALNLDGIDSRCTRSDAAVPTSCVPFGQSEVLCDDEGGRDNAFVRALAAAQGVQSNVVSLASDMEIGGPSLVIQIDGYSQADSVDGVLVSFFSATGTTPLADAGIDDHPRPAWDGTDRWAIDTRSVVGIGTGTGSLAVQSTRGRIVDGVLVAQLDELDLPLAVVPRAVLHLKGGFVTARVVHDANGRVRLEEGRLASRVLVRDLLKGASANDGGPCETVSGFTQLRTSLCFLSDLPANAEDPSTTTCAALSLAIGFVAYPIAGRDNEGSPRVYATGCTALDGGLLEEQCLR